jgi:hypothetical protein
MYELHVRQTLTSYLQLCSTPKDYLPPNPAYCARFSPQMNNLVLAVIGAQYPLPSDYNDSAISTIKS